jgi:hypothetical protein
VFPEEGIIILQGVSRRKSLAGVNIVSQLRLVPILLGAEKQVGLGVLLISETWKQGFWQDMHPQTSGCV